MRNKHPNTLVGKRLFVTKSISGTANAVERLRLWTGESAICTCAHHLGDHSCDDEPGHGHCSIQACHYNFFSPHKMKHKLCDNTNVKDQSVQDNKEQKIAKLYQIAQHSIEELFKDQLNNTYAAFKIDGHIETIPIAINGKFKIWVSKTSYETQNELMTNIDALTAASSKLVSENSRKEKIHKSQVSRLVTLRCLSQDCIGQYINNSGLFEVRCLDPSHDIQTIQLEPYSSKETNDKTDNRMNECNNDRP